MIIIDKVNINVLLAKHFSRISYEELDMIAKKIRLTNAST